MFLEKLLQKECSKRSLVLENFRYQRDAAQGLVNGYFLHAKNPQCSVFFVHGFGNDSLFPQIPFLLYLAEHGVNVFTIDMDGHGVQSTTFLFAEHMESCVRDGLAFARGKVPGQDFHLIGHSLGALLSLHACARENLGLRSLVLISLAHSIRFDTPVLMSEAFLSVFTGSFYRALFFYRSKFLPALGPIGRSRFPLRFRGEQKEAVRQLFQKVQSLLNTSVQTDLPTLYCYGTLDKITPLDKEKLSLKNEDELYIMRGETHLTTVSASSLERKVLEWILSHHANLSS